MKVKEAVEVLESAKQSASGYGNTYMALEKLPQVIELLQQGEKYRLILKDLDRQYGHYLIGVKGNGEIGIGYTIRDFVEKVEQKYFIKGD